MTGKGIEPYEPKDGIVSAADEIMPDMDYYNLPWFMFVYDGSNAKYLSIA